MLDKARNKLKKEMEKEKNHPYVAYIGQHLLKHLEANPQSAEKLAAEDKSILKSLEAMRKAAEKKKFGNMAMITDEEGFDIVFKYYGIRSASQATAELPTPPKPTRSFNVKLDELLKKGGN
ncbi:hypothetical protein ACWKT5_13460 [Streptomyces avermitilis]